MEEVEVSGRWQLRQAVRKSLHRSREMGVGAAVAVADLVVAAVEQAAVVVVEALL